MDKSSIREDFPILSRRINDAPMIYLDSAATSQKPQVVIDKITDYYTNTNANVHRGVSSISVQATDEYEQSRGKVAKFIHAKSDRQIVFTRSTTESLNWIANGYAKDRLMPGDEIVISVAEHHSNIIPWQQIASATGAKLKYVQVNDEGQIDLHDTKRQITNKTKIVSMAMVSNVMGATNPVKEVTKMAHAVGAKMIVDAAQSAPHMPVDVSDIDCDFLAFSGHKMLAPTGIGVLYGKMDVLNEMDPVQFGGEMIDIVSRQAATFQPVPHKFEAGTPNIAGAIALGTAIDYLNSIGMDNIHEYEEQLTQYCMQKMQKIDGISIYGSDDFKYHNGIVTFNIKGIHPHDVATGLDLQGIEVRAGHHCAQPLMDYLEVESTVRVSFYFYNNQDDVKRFIEALINVKEFFANGNRQDESII
ncbi:cysteine desulfurase [Apilactobacillus kunkeei]|uniref:Cysteine desulfurase n=1 Tax=Apilactobacillus kunkeei TaxID=148814 RepID=A0A0M9DFE1_9LACO|nr:cysteine desulfurase [Apilactobacillus kunkeei]KOY79743.1 Cysteine desulfurase [Apilactobacillus kunkeei]